MSSEDDFQRPIPDPALKRLDFLVGRWRLTGRFGPVGGALGGQATFEWLEGGFFLVHRWRLTFDAGGKVIADTGYKFYDYSPETGSYRATFFGNHGPYDESRSRYRGEFVGDSLIMVGPTRITHRPVAADSVDYDTDLPDGRGGWTPFLLVNLTRV